ncbi:MAG: S16 family serine protease [Akkermansiaceae bacterium]
MKIAVASLTFLFSALVLMAEHYRPPNMDKEVFDMAKVKIDKISRSSLFSGLLSVAKDFDEENGDVDYELRAHALGIAGRINPDSENFQDVLGQLEEDGKTVMDDEVEKSRVISKIYRGVRILMRKNDNKDNVKCAKFCVDIALRFDAEEEAKDIDKLKNIAEEIGKPDWKDMLGAVIHRANQRGVRANNEFKERSEIIPGGDAKKFAATQRSVYGLSVRQLPNGKHAGAASSLSATALRDEEVDGVEFHIDQKVGNMTGNSLEEIKKLMRVRHEEAGRVPSNYKVEIAFEDKDGLLDGPSAGTAMSIIIDSLFTGRELDDIFAVTGAITADGKVTKIGGVAGKIRGATKKECKLVGVPHENIPGVSDIYVLDGIEPLINIQVFSLKKLDQAINIAAKDKPEEVAKAIEDFNKIAELLKDKGESTLKNAKVKSMLEDLCKAMPNHESARILLGIANGSAPKKLSVGGSFHVIDTASSGISKKVTMITWTEEYERNTADIEEAEETIKELEGLNGKVDGRLSDYHKAMLKITKVFRDGREDGESEDEFVERIGKVFEEVQAKRKKLMEDPEIMEEIYR